MKKLMVPASLALIVALGSYALLGQQSPMQGGHDDMMGGGTNTGMMGNMSCSGCAMMPTALAATSDGGVILAAGGKLVKYDAGLAKVAEADIDIDGDAMQKKMQQSCPMSQIMK